MTRSRRAVVAGLAAASLCAVAAGPAHAQDAETACRFLFDQDCREWADRQTSGAQERLEYEVCKVYAHIAFIYCEPPSQEWP